MDTNTLSIEELAALNPCIKFIIDNYDILCIAHYNKTVLVVDTHVVKTFPSMVDAMMFTDAIDMRNVAYAMKECNGYDATTNLVFSNACRTPS